MLFLESNNGASELSDRIRLKTAMVRQLNASSFVQLRALIIIAALIAFCASSNVGPQFLPLPALGPSSPSHSRVAHHEINADLHSDFSANFRVPILADTQRRAERKSQDQSVAELPGIGFVSSNASDVSPDDDHQTSRLASVSASPPPGRAPPRLT
jgi:hypothetical protein